MAGEGLAGRAVALKRYVDEMRGRTGYNGPVDVVCHSIGACIARQFLEVVDGSARRARARQLIMLGPPNNGSALAELFSDSDRGHEVIDLLAGVFVPSDFDPLADPIVQDVRPGSRTMGVLRAAGTRDDIAYRVIATANPGAADAFFPWFGGRTWKLDGNGRFRQTLHGDGVVANSESVLPGVPLEVLAPGPDDGRQIPPLHFCHIQLPRNPAVIDRVMEHLLDPTSSERTASNNRERDQRSIRPQAPSRSETGTEQSDDDHGVERHEERHRDDESQLARLVMEDTHAGHRPEGSDDGGEEKRPLGDPAQMQPRAPLVGRVQDEDREVRDDVDGQGEKDRIDRNHLRLHGGLFGRSAGVP